MKNNIYLLAATVILTGVFTVSTQAQSRNRQLLTVNVPFAFNVGNEILPAGEYRVKIVNPTSDHSVLQISALNGKANAMVRTIDIENGSTTKGAQLAFRHYGERYYLAQVWMTSETTGLAAQQSSSEKTLQRQLGQATKNFDMVAVNAR